MSLTSQIAKHFIDLYFGGNWTSVNVRDSLNGVTWQQATTKVYDLNTIAALTFHTNYYVRVVMDFLQEGVFNAHRKYSYDLTPINSIQAWESLMTKSFEDAIKFASIVEQLPDSKLGETFVEGRYGSYYRNLHGIIEHTHYHLGQIVLIKKILGQQALNRL